MNDHVWSVAELLEAAGVPKRGRRMLEPLAEMVLEVVGLTTGRAIFQTLTLRGWNPDDSVATLMGLFFGCCRLAA